MPTYYVEPQYEPRGDGGGWEVAPNDSMATTFCVVQEMETTRSVIDAKPTRAAANAVISKLTAARRVHEEYPPEDPIGAALRSWPKTIAWGIPAVLLFWAIAAGINRLNG